MTSLRTQAAGLYRHWVTTLGPGLVFLTVAAGSLFTLSCAGGSSDGDDVPNTPQKVRFETTKGAFVIELHPDKAPISVANFLRYVDAGFYEGTIIHRVVKGFVIQAGGISADMHEKPAFPPIKNEATNGLSNLRGTVSMARMDDPDSASSHFFINLVDNTRLDHKGAEKYGYAVFGRVVEGMDVVDKISKVAVATRGEFENVPVEAITITAVARVR